MQSQTIVIDAPFGDGRARIEATLASARPEFGRRRRVQRRFALAGQWPIESAKPSERGAPAWGAAAVKAREAQLPEPDASGFDKAPQLAYLWRACGFGDLLARKGGGRHERSRTRDTQAGLRALGRGRLPGRAKRRILARGAGRVQRRPGRAQGAGR